MRQEQALMQEHAALTAADNEGLVRTSSCKRFPVAETLVIAFSDEHFRVVRRKLGVRNTFLKNQVPTK